jgi:hypothetical protein
MSLRDDETCSLPGKTEKSRQRNESQGNEEGWGAVRKVLSERDIFGMVAFESPQVENLRNGRQECLRYAGVLLQFVTEKFQPFLRDDETVRQKHSLKKLSKNGCLIRFPITKNVFYRAR